MAAPGRYIDLRQPRRGRPGDAGVLPADPADERLEGPAGALPRLRPRPPRPATRRAGPPSRPRRNQVPRRGPRAGVVAEAGRGRAIAGPACYPERLGCTEADHATRRRARHPGARGRLRRQAACRPAAGGAGVPEHLLRRDVQPGLPDGLPAVQRARRRRLRALLPAAQADAGRARGCAARGSSPSNRRRRSPTSTSSRSRCRSSGTTRTS